MPKKLNILSAAAAISISTLGGLVPTFADSNITYQVPEITPLYSSFASDMRDRCGDFVDEYTYWTCLNNVRSEYTDRYGGQFTSMYELIHNGRMIVTGINPVAGTLRFYLDENMGFQTKPFTYENLVIFWTDRTAEKDPAWNDVVGWEFVDNYLATGEIPQGYHILYSGRRGDANWPKINEEVRVLYDLETNTLEEVTQTNPYRHIYLYGYDTEGNRRLENNSLDCLDSSLWDGDECRLVYEYNGTSATPTYVRGELRGEDATAVALSQALKAKAEAEEALAQAQAAFSEAESRAYQAEMSYLDLQNQLFSLESSIMDYQMRIFEANENLARAEEALKLAEEVASKAQSELEAAIARAEAAEKQAKSIEESAASEIAALKSTIESLKQALNEACASEAEAIKAKETAESLVLETKKALEEANLAAENSKKRLADALAELENLKNNPTVVTNTVYRTIEKLVKDTSTENTVSEGNLVAETSTSEIKEQTNENPEERVELPMAGNEEHVFPWWIIVFAFTGIALIFWWIVPNRRKSED